MIPTRLGLLLASFSLLLPAAARSQEPLHTRIDALVAAKSAGHPIAPPADDASFVRRVYLDFAGRIPSTSEVRAFLADATPDKRTRLIDQLLAAPEYSQRMTELFHVILMERRGDHEEWQKFLRASFAANKPWDQMVREILKPNPDDETTRGAAFFYTKRLENYGQNAIDFPGLTRDVGRLFLGKDLQCAQCHDHLFIDDYKQVDFQGLFTIYQDTLIRTDVAFPAVSEKPKPQKLEFVSVFDPTKNAVGPRIPDGKEFDIPQPVPEAGGYSPLTWLSMELPNPNNKLFSQNIANRLWFIMLGRGLVHPLDLYHSQNPPSHPELLDLLAQEFVAHGYDIKWMLRELALSQTYQRASAAPEGQAVPPPESYAIANQRRLSAEQLLRSVLQATGELDRAIKESATPDVATGPSLKELQERFIAAFANPAREPEDEFNASVKAALFLLNDDKMLQLLQPRPGNLMERLGATASPEQAAEELFLSILSRQPTDEERTDVVQYLATMPDRRPIALSHLAWSMLSSLEFYVNH